MIVEERISAYINSLGHELPDELLELEHQAQSNHVPIIKRETQGLLLSLIRTQKPKKILEVGTAVGFSALFMSKYSHPQCKITTIERGEIYLAEARKNLADNKYPYRDKIKLIEDDAIYVLKNLADEKFLYDFIFLDAAKGQYINFLPNIIKILDKGGVLVTDNVLQDGTVVNSRYAIKRRDRTVHSRMREYLYAITHMDELESIILPVGDGVSISYRR